MSRTDSLSTNKYNLKLMVKLPEREKPEEWIAHNLFDFHKQTCMLFGTIRDHCNQVTCPKLIAKNLSIGVSYEYVWSSINKLSASEHIQHILDWIQEQLDDEDVFHSISDRDFPSDFNEICKTIAKRLLRVYAHIYHHHLDQIKSLAEEAHFNTSLKHFIYFIQEFKLVPPNELNALREFVKYHTEYPSASFQS